MAAEGSRLAVGTQAGDVIVLDAPMLRRRLARDDEAEAVDDEAAAHRAAMLAKLKALRN